MVMFIVAVIGLLGNIITAALLYRSFKENINIRSAYIHILSDAFISVGVIIAGILILQYQLYIIDTILTLIIAGYILWHSYYLLRQTINILMESTPSGLELLSFDPQWLKSEVFWMSITCMFGGSTNRIFCLKAMC